jgi:hypothetical protein
VLQLSHACGVEHPALITSEHLDIVNDHFGRKSLSDCFAYEPAWSLPSAADCEAVKRLMAG